MNPAYLLALKLGIPVIVQPEWNERQKFRKKGEDLIEEGLKLQEEGWKLWGAGWKLQEKGYKLREEGWGLRKEGVKLYREAITRELGPEYVLKINWKTGEVK